MCFCLSRPSFNFGFNNLCATFAAPANVKTGAHTRHMHYSAAISEIRCGDPAGIVIPGSSLLLRLSSKKLAALDAPQQKELSDNFDALLKAFSKVHNSVLCITPTEALENRLVCFSNDDQFCALQRHNTRFSGHVASEAIESSGFFVNPVLIKVEPPSPEIAPLPVSYPSERLSPDMPFFIVELPVPQPKPKLDNEDIAW